MVGYARVVIDRATFGEVRDLVVVPRAPPPRARSQAGASHPGASGPAGGCAGLMLATADAHALYESEGFAPPGRDLPGSHGRTGAALFRVACRSAVVFGGAMEG